MISTLRVAPLAERQVAAAGRVLARAFDVDPLWRFVLPDTRERRRCLPLYFSSIVHYGRLAGEVDGITAGRRLLGVAVWLRSGVKEHPSVRVEHLERSGLLQTPDVLGPGPFERLTAVVGHLDGVRRRTVREPHWYLSQVGVEPDAQGRGAGSALLQPGLARAALDDRPCYLETFGAHNLAFYSRLGFVQGGADVEPVGGLRFWTYLRYRAPQPVLNAG